MRLFRGGRPSAARGNQVLFSTLGAVLDFADACPPGDDLTLLVIRRCEAALAERASEHKKSFAAPRRQQTPAARPAGHEQTGNDYK